MPKFLAISLLSLFSLQISFSQGFSVSGKVVSSNTQESLNGANIELVNSNDSTDIHSTLSDGSGSFSFVHLKKTNYNLSVSFIGYQKVTKNVQILFREQTLGNIPLVEQAEELNEVTVTKNAPQAILKGDTTEFVASAFKVTQDANVEDLVKKIPGVTVEDGTVKAQGEEVKKVLVDGKAFFGDDPSIALKNLPAEIVEKVQVFDEQSEQSQFTGFNDGQTTKTLNIVTRNNKRNGTFGKATAAYGNEDRYSIGANINKFDGDKRFSVIASSNNVNQQNFGMQDFLGAMSGQGGRDNNESGGGMRRNTRSSGSGSQNGLSTINSIGLNYGNNFGKKLNLSGSYFFNNNNNDNDQLSNTEYILSTDSSRIENSKTISETKNYNNRINLKAEWSIDTMNTLIINPSVNFQSNKSISGGFESQSMSIADNLLPQYTSESSNNKKTTGYNITNRLTYRHKFQKNRRTFSIDQNASFSKKEPYTTTLSNVDYLTSGIETSTNRITSTLTDGYSFTTNIAYTEPFGERSLIQFNAKNSFSNTYSYKRTKDLDTLTTNYIQIDTLSNKYFNNYITNCVGLSYRFQDKRLTASAGFEIQNSNLSGEQTFPHETNTAKHFNNILPNFQLRYRVTQQQNLSVNYNTSTNPPSIDQLQNVAEYSSNLTKVTIGNPNLEPQYQHNINSRLMYVNREKGTNFFFLLGSTISQNSIGNSTIYYDTIQVTKPVNKGTGYTLRSMVNFGISIKPIKCNLNLITGYNFNKTPGFVNGKDNIAKTNSISQSIVISSNISEKLDFTLSSNGSYTFVDNSVASGNDDNYYSQNSGFRLNWIFWKGFTLQNDITNKFYQGMSSGYNQNTTLINIGIGKKIFKKDAGEIKLTVYDLLNNNTSISRTVTANQIIDQESISLNRYILASFTYTFRSFKQGDMPKNEHRHDDIDGPPMRGGEAGPPPPGF